MKKPFSKLTLKRETVRTLVDAELARVIGGDDTNCTGATKLASSCSSNFQADSLALNQQIK